MVWARGPEEEIPSDLHLFCIAGHWIPVAIIPIRSKIIGLKRHHPIQYIGAYGGLWRNRWIALFLVSDEGIFQKSNTNIGWKLTMQGWVGILRKTGNLIFRKSADYQRTCRCWKNADVQTDFALMFVTVLEKCWVRVCGDQSFQMTRCSFLRNNMFPAVTLSASCSSADRAAALHPA